MPSSPSPAYDAALVARIIEEHRPLEGPLMPVLHAVQHALGHVPPASVPQIAEALNLSRAEVHGVLTYYTHFRQAPAEGPVLQVCRAESCRTMGGEALLAQARAAGGCCVEPVYCLGLCALSPAVMLDGVPHARMTPAKLVELMRRGEA
ncbi:MAG TPA: NAD(P)H-dependent oxidoreductase subunit E [Burkholderiaceae bacterium]|nr:NAD(P)H-dependent oxidoreductase subunit E [Burkholderiaceae bacterium]